MKRIILFDTSIATQNKGDEIIMESVRRELEPVLKGNFVYNFPTHLVSFPFGHQFTSSKANLAKKMKAQGLDSDTIHKITGISIDEINKL